MEAKYSIYLYVNILNNKTILTIINMHNHEYKCCIVINNLYKYMALTILREASNKLMGSKHLTNYQKRLNVLFLILQKYNIKNITNLDR